MAGQNLQYLLVPDTSAARRLRRTLAARRACSGIITGTWPELMKSACRAYLLPETTDDNDNDFRQALEELEDAFWARSLSVAPVETSEAVKSALIQIVSATDPASDIDIADLQTGSLAERPRRHLDDLFRLARLLEGRWPRELSMMQSLFSADPRDALHTFRVYHIEAIPRLTRWQTRLVEKLNRDSDNPAQHRDEQLPRILSEVLGGDPAGAPASALYFVQQRLFEAVTKTDRREADESVQWVGTRDFLQEAEVAAGMVQSMLAGNTNLKPADTGLLIPDSFEYATALEDVFALGGMALSGLPAERWRRDLGREAVFHFLYCRQKPAPAMALAICLSSPLMPWSREQGAILAQAVMDGDYRLRPFSPGNRDEQTMLDLLRDGDVEPASLASALPEFVSLLRASEGLAGHVQQARAAVGQLQDSLQGAAAIDWTALRRAVSPKFITSGESPDFNLEGVTVWRESQAAWRPVKRLIVLGFAQGHYPSALASDPVFSAADLESIREQTGLPVSLPAAVLEGSRLRFKRQLGAVSESVTFLIPHRNPRGERQSPSESLVFMHQLFTGPESAHERIVELDAHDDHARPRHISLAATASPRPPRALLAEDLDFHRDLLALRTDPQGQLKPESPSSLETLMVSGLAWLLRRLKAEPSLWAPEAVDGALLGTLAHSVFEGLFRPGEAPPDPGDIPGRVETLLEEAIRKLAPFLRASRWQVERRHFKTETIKAARAWSDILARLDAQVLATETWIQGTWSGIPIHGQTDLLLGLPGKQLLVVDYKRSKSGNRRPRMEKGYDSQASLYRAMLASGGLKDDTDETLRTRICAAARPGIVYYMLNDQVSLSDSALPGSAAVPGWQTLENNVASQAMALIRRRLDGVRVGEVRLNRDSDAGFFEKEAGITPYALRNSPLIGLFTVAGEAGEPQ